MIFPDHWTTAFKDGEDEDAVTAHFDKALTAANRELAALTLRFEASEIADMFLHHIETHMAIELCAIHNGPSDDCYHELNDDDKATSEALQPLRRLGKAVQP